MNNISEMVSLLKQDFDNVYKMGKKEFLNAFWNARSIYENMRLTLGAASLNDGYVTITPRQNGDVYGNGQYLETYFTLSIPDDLVTGEYCVIKYRTVSDGRFDLYTSTVSSSAESSDYTFVNRIGDGEWHVLVFNVAKCNPDRFIKDADGKYRAKYIRFDVFSADRGAADAVDVAYIGICDSFEKALTFADTDRVSYVEALERIKTIFTNYDKVDSFYSTEGLVFVANSTCSECGVGEYAVSGYNGADTAVVIPPLYITDDYECYPVREIRSLTSSNRYNGIKSVSIPSSVRSIGERAFFNSPGIRKIEFSEGLRNIGKEAFVNLASIDSITIPDSVEFIGWQAFQYCTAAKSLYIGKGVKDISYALFYGCGALKEVKIAGDIKSISDLAFYDCWSCLSYDFSACATVPQLADVNAFFQGINADCKIYVPAALLDEWRAATNWAEYADYIVTAE